MPDFTEWFKLERDKDGDVMCPDYEAVVRRWHAEAGCRLLPLLMYVNDDWVCLDAWKWPEGTPMPDYLPVRTEEEIPVGFV